MSLKVRTATVHDVEALTALLAQLFEQELEFDPEPDAQARGLHWILANPKRGQILVAEDASGVVGMVSLLFTISTALGREAALLEDMIVATDSRGNGVGDALMAEAEVVCEARGIARITLLTDRDNQGAHRFYKRAGFKPSDMVVFRKHGQQGQ